MRLRFMNADNNVFHSLLSVGSLSLANNTSQLLNINLQVRSI